MGDQLVDRDGNVYQRSWDGEYRAKEGIFGPVTETDMFGNARVERDFLGNPKPQRDWLGNEITSISGRSLYRYTPSAGGFTGLFQWVMYVTLITAFILAFHLIKVAFILVVQLISLCFSRPKVGLPLTGMLAAIGIIVFIAATRSSDSTAVEATSAGSVGSVGAQMVAQTCSSSTLFVVRADRAWQDTGISVNRVRTITYQSGLWTTNINNPQRNPYTDADGYQWKWWDTTLPNSSYGGLIGRAGHGPPFWVGSRFSGSISGTGNLFLMTNDPGTFDNAGTISVNIGCT